MKPLALTGQKFGRLFVTGHAVNKSRKTFWHVRCDCGVARIVMGTHLRRGNTTSCGCKGRETLNKRNVTHGFTGTKTYVCWQNMRKRCQDSRNVAFEYYGGRGITVCERWRKFENFLQDMGVQPPGLTIERIDNNAGYSPGNCKWATYLEQSSNSRKSRLLTSQGMTLTMRQWDKKLGRSEGRVALRLRRGWSVRRALEEPCTMPTEEGSFA